MSATFKKPIRNKGYAPTFKCNIYSVPEDHELEIVGMVEVEPDYSFNMFVVWKEKYGNGIYYLEDSGCSCPSPFEDIKNVDQLNRIDKTNFDIFEIACRNFSSNEGRPTADEKRNLIEKVKKLL